MRQIFGKNWDKFQKELSAYVQLFCSAKIVLAKMNPDAIKSIYKFVRGNKREIKDLRCRKTPQFSIHSHSTLSDNTAH